MKEASHTHGGNLRRLAQEAGCRAEEILDFSANLNPMGAPEWLRPLVASQVASLVHYPDPDCVELLRAASIRYEVPVDCLLATSGAEEFLYLLPRVAGKARAVVPVPAYIDYAKSASLAGLAVESFALEAEAGFAMDFGRLESCLRGDEIVYLGHPNNPTGVCLDREKTIALIRRNPGSLFVVDEAFADFVSGGERFYGQGLPNLLLVLSLTKIYAVPGLRLAVVVGSREWIGRIRPHLPTWNVNAIAQAVGVKALEDNEFLLSTREMVSEEREFLQGGLAEMPGIFPYRGSANFLLVRSEVIPVRELYLRLLAKRIAIRDCGDYGGLGEEFFRVAVRRREENQRLLEAMEEVLGVGRERGKARKRQAVSIMFQGTSSNAGKSVLAAALCRILRQDGLQVVPFKSQNMALNSFVTRCGGEIGRAQAVQAQACRIEADVRMNPILLKPNSHTGSQVIVMGKAVGNMEVREYFRYKPQAFLRATEAYKSLAQENEVIVIEGAGSPGEINLKRHDIANMVVAKMANAPVLLVGDIDRGGVYASFVGTMEVLAEWEREMVAGFIVNRFRGQESLLADAHEAVRRHTGVSVFGVVPYLSDLGLPEEDSVSFKASTELSGGEDGGDGCLLDLAIIDLPHISNFTDFDPFRGEPGVRLRIVRSVEEMGNPDAIFLPGSKNVAGDFADLKKRGLVEAIRQRENACEIVGICGGYQMLGKTIEDFGAVESKKSVTEGMGLLSIATTMAKEKTLERGSYQHLVSGLPVRGYEIHHGQTRVLGEVPVVVRDAGGGSIGHGTERVWGSYLHGLFDDDAFRRYFLDGLRERKGFPPVRKILACYNIEAAFDRLAEVVRSRIDMKKIYQLLRLP